MRDRPPILRNDPSVPPGAAAEAHLRYIRQMMERTAAFTGVPGKGGIAMGVIGLMAATAATQVDSVVTWMGIWSAAAILGLIIGVVAIARKASRHGIPLLSGQGRKFLLGLGPSMLAGAALTLAVYGLDAGPASDYALGDPPLITSLSLRLLPGTWLLLYGAGVVAAGIFSVRPVPILGGAIMAVGLLALVTPAAWGSVWMGVGFGVLNITFGIVIARRYGG